MHNMEDINKEIQKFLDYKPEPFPINQLSLIKENKTFEKNNENNLQKNDNYNSQELIKFLEKTLDRNKHLDREIKKLSFENSALKTFEIKSKQQENKLKELTNIMKQNDEQLKSLNEQNKGLLNEKEQFEGQKRTLKEEINFFSNQIRNKEFETKNLNKKLNEQLNSKKTVKEKFLEIEKICKLYQRKIGDKQHTINYLNSELNKFINNEKKIKLKLEGLNEKSGYFEQMYKFLEEQNDFLIRKLKKIGSSDVLSFIKENNLKKEEWKSKIEKQKPSFIFRLENSFNEKKQEDSENELRKKLQKKKENLRINKKETESLKNKMKILKEEVEERKKFSERQQKENNVIIDNLMKKMEKLLEENLKFQANEIKKPLEDFELKEKKEKVMESFFADPSFDATREAIRIGNLGNFFDKNSVEETEKYENEPKFSFTDNLFKLFKENNKKEKSPKPMKIKEKSANSMKIKEKSHLFSKIDLMKNLIKEKASPNKNEEGSFIKICESSESDLLTNNFKNLKIKEKKEPKIRKKKKIEELSNSKILTTEEQKEFKKAMKNTKIKKNTKTKKFSAPSYNLKEISLEDFEPSTTDSMKKMRERTQKLDEKFDKLADKLEKLKEFDEFENSEINDSHVSNIQLQDEDFL